MKKFFFALTILLIFGINLYAQINVGDVKTFWSVSYIDWDANDPQVEITATCKAVSEHCYLFVDNNAYQPNQSQIDALINKFETVFVPIQTDMYGNIPDALDNDPRIYMLAIGNTWWAGYFDPGQQMSDSIVYNRWGKHSSEKEIIYFASSYFGNSYLDEVVSHEFGHMLHWLQDHSPEPPENPTYFWEEAWIDEQFSTFSPVMTLEGLNNNDIMDNSAFFALEPNTSLIHFSSYNAGKLFITFMYEHYGDTAYIKTLIKEQANGILGVNKTLTNLGYQESFEDVFNQWIIANYLDNTTYQNGKYGYKHYNFTTSRPEINISTYPTSVKTGYVLAYGSKNIKFNTAVAKPIKINFNGTDYSSYRVSLILYNNTPSQIYDIVNISLDADNDGNFIADKFGTDYNKIVMIVMNTDELLGSGQYSAFTYQAVEYISDINDNLTDMPNQFVLSANYPNPFNPTTTIEYTLPVSCNVKIEIFNPIGQLIDVLLNAEQNKGGYNLGWDAGNLSGGVYYIKLSAQNQSGNLIFSKIQKAILLK
ncbi:MAG: T9SS type A sorting domain-containing protein [bacterium]